MIQKYYESDANLRDLGGNSRIAVIGYGSQGQGQALNLRDSGSMSSLACAPEIVGKSIRRRL